MGVFSRLNEIVADHPNVKPQLEHPAHNWSILRRAAQNGAARLDPPEIDIHRITSRTPRALEFLGANVRAAHPHPNPPFTDALHLQRQVEEASTQHLTCV